MKERAEKKPVPRIGRKDLQDPDRAPSDRSAEPVDREDERSDRQAGAGRPVQLDPDGRRRAVPGHAQDPADAPERTGDDAPPVK
jgi:hypothetical protein